MILYLGRLQNAEIDEFALELGQQKSRNEAKQHKQNHHPYLSLIIAEISVTTVNYCRLIIS